jgi:hypothetical protein
MGEEYAYYLYKQSFEKSLSECVDVLQKLKQLVKKAILQRMESCYEDPESCATAASSANSVIHELTFRIIPSVISASLEEIVESK